MAMDASILAEEVVKALADPRMDGEARKTMLEAWKKIAKAFIEHITENAEWSTEVRKVVSATQDGQGIITVAIQDPIYVPPTELDPEPVQPVPNLIIGDGLGIK